MSARLTLTVTLLLSLAPAVSGAVETRGFVLTTDFSTGGLSVVNLATREVRLDVAQPPPNSDARLRWHQGLIYVVNRLGAQNANNIQIIDPAQRGQRAIADLSIRRDIAQAALKELRADRQPHMHAAIEDRIGNRRRHGFAALRQPEVNPIDRQRAGGR